MNGPDLLSTDAPNPSRHQKALELAETGRNQEALECLQEHLMAHPRDSQALNDTAVVLHALGRCDQAAQHLQAAIDVSRGWAAQAAWNLIEVHMAAHRPGEILALLDRLIEAGTLTPQLANHAAARLFQAGDAGSAVGAFARSLEVRPEQEAVVPLLEHMRAGAFPGPEPSWNGTDDGVLQIGPEARRAAGERFRRYTVAKELGDCCAAAGNWALAKDCYEQAAYLEPDRPGAYLGLGVVAARDDQLDLALEAFEAALSADHNCAEAYGGMAMIHQQKKHYHQAFDLYLRCLERDTDNLVALLGLFQTSCQMGTFARVIEFLEAYLDRHRADTAVLFCLATLYAREGRLDDAKYALLEVLAIEPDKAEATDLLAQVHRSIHRAQETRPA